MSTAVPPQIGAQRYADSQTASVYPLACTGDIHWHITGATAVCRLHIAQIPEASILIPSLSVLNQGDYAYDVKLIHENTEWRLAPVPNTADQNTQTPRPMASDAISTHIDCFHVHEALTAMTLEFRVHSPSPPPRYLVTATWRPLEVTQPEGPLTSACCAPPPAVSQMSEGGSAGPAICSPACLTMALRGFSAKADLLQIAAECYDPATRMYGVWPNAIRTAASRGIVGATEALFHWDDAQCVLERGYPLITSIRFSPGKLPGAPLNATNGHLLLVHGASPEGIMTNDPAAPNVASVPRTYDATAFTQAWLSYRGAAYILVP